MTSFGVTSEGLTAKTVQDILDELDDDERAAFGAAINTTPESVLGQLNSIFGDKVAEMWELALAVWASQYPDTAQGTSLDNVAAITGAERLGATKSAVDLSLNLTAGTILLAGRIVSSSETGSRFVTTEDVQNSNSYPANIDTPAESEEYGPIVGSATTIDRIETPVAGWTAQAAIDSDLSEPFALSNGQTLLVKVDDGSEQTVTFLTGDFVAIGAATAQEIADVINANTTGIDAMDAGGMVRIQSDTDGPGSAIEVTGGSANPQIGFDTDRVAGLNPDDAVLGTNLETDSEFRIRREELLRISGAATLEAIRSAVLDVDDVVQALVFENTTMVTNPDGLPPKSFEVVASGGTDQAIAQTIFDNKPIGIETYRDPGANGRTVPIDDSQGTTHNINFSRPTDIRIYAEVTIAVDSAAFGGGDVNAGKQQVREALALLSQQQQIGEDVVAIRYRCAPLGVTGVTDVTLLKIDTVTPPVNQANIVMAVRELANIDTGDVDVLIP
jgi:hypothetical protein